MIGDNKNITYFAETDSRNRRVAFGIKSEDRSRHVYLIGKTGMGKSTVLENMTIQDIQNGNGLAFLDPHGKTADLFLEYVPEERIKDVIYFAPFDTDFPISFNVMEDVGVDKRHLVVNGLMSAFKKIWVDAWSARMEYILNNAMLALLEYPGSTLIGINRMFADKDYRKKVVENVSDPSVKAFWVDEFAKYTDKYMQEATAAIQNKIGQFVSNPLVRNIIGQPKSNLDFRKVMDEKKILLVNLSKGRVGEANANLLGSMIITKLYLAAMSRADASESEMRALPNFYLYVDEFQNFANESFADILSEARKYKLNLTVAHQYIEQMSDEVRAAIFGNVGTMISFRVGAYDAEVLEKEFAPKFTMEDLVNLGRFQIYLKLMIDGVSSSPFSAGTLPQIDRPIISYAKEIVDYSRAHYAKPRNVVEDDIRDWHAPVNSQVNNNLDPKRENAHSFNGVKVRQEPDRFNNTNNGNFQRPPQRPQQENYQVRQPQTQQTSYRSPQPQNTPPARPVTPPAAPIVNTSNVVVSAPVNSPVPKPTVPQNNSNQREMELRKAISLSYLNKEPEKPKSNKTATNEHVSALKSALQDILKNQQNIQKQSATPPPASSYNKEEVRSNNTHPQNKVVEANIPQKPKEIPEDVLRKMLEVKD